MKWTVKPVAEVVEGNQIEHVIARIESADGISPATVGLTMALTGRRARLGSRLPSVGDDGFASEREVVELNVAARVAAWDSE